MIVFKILIGIVLLSVGGELLIRGSSNAARRLGISPVLVGVLVLGLGTSSPEFIVSFKAALNGYSGIALGNVIGSNILNIGVVLALCAVIFPIQVKTQIVKREIPLMIFCSLLLIVFLNFGIISTLEGIILLILLVIYILYIIFESKKKITAADAEEYENGIPQNQKKLYILILYIVFGLGLLIWGADIFVSGAVKAAELLGLSQTIIGLTIVAIGTSLPELITTLFAALKKEGDLALGNIIGSNFFNICGILGITSIVKPIPIEEIDIIDQILFLGFAVIILPFSITKFKLTRLEGIFLLIIYSIYLYKKLWI